MVRLTLHPASLSILLALAGLFSVRAVVAQSLLDGYWVALYDEDYIERDPGPDQGEYAGLPITPAAISVARTWDPERLTLPELQCRPHPAIYGFRGFSDLRIWEDRDPATQQQTQIETWIVWMSQHRHIWMVPHAHPPPWSGESWQGYSTGKWVGNVLQVHTDLVKAAWIRRNGLPTDDKATMDERFFRYEDVLTDIMIISDPQYLSEPEVKSNEFFYEPNGANQPYPCNQADEVPRSEGIVPMHLPGQDALVDEWAVRNNVPLAATHGGAATMYPEYQRTMEGLPKNPSLAELKKSEQGTAQHEAQ